MTQRVRQRAAPRNLAAKAGKDGSELGARVAAVRASALHPNAKHVLQVLLEHEGGNGMPAGQAALTQPEMARACGVTVMTVSRMLEQLELEGLLTIDRVHGLNVLPNGQRTAHGCCVYSLRFEAIDRLADGTTPAAKRPLRSILCGPDPTVAVIIDFLAARKERNGPNGQGRGAIAGAKRCIPL